MTHDNLVHKFIPMPQAMKILDAKAASDKEWDKLKKLPAWREYRVKSKKKFSEQAKNKERRFILLRLFMDVCNLRNSELENKFQKYKGRVLLREDVEKDDSGSPGSSVSHMTAAKVLVVISRLLDCAGEANDAV